MKIRLAAAEVLHVDRQTDRHDEANSRCLGILRTRLRRLES
jgi:hypothetical protein